MIFITALHWFIWKILKIKVDAWIWFWFSKILKETKFWLWIHTCSPNWPRLGFCKTYSAIILAIPNSKMLKNFVFMKKHLISNNCSSKRIWEMRWLFSYLFFDSILRSPIFFQFFLHLCHENCVHINCVLYRSL